ncbi:GAF domain-containing protein, partial [Patescibacteria group bacterium]|nr:GAF domain-containing protein [Patescibacteria group bacterium]
YDFSKIKIAIDDPINHIGETAKYEKSFSGKRLVDFTRGFVKSEKLIGVYQKVSTTKFMMTVPIFSSGKVEGVLYVGTAKDSFTPDQISLIKIFAEQLGLAMGNIIAHEKIIEKFKDEQERKKRQTDPDKIPNIKFTLRISKEIDRYLNWKVHNTKKTKADFLREAILEDLMEPDEEYKKFSDD